MSNNANSNRDDDKFFPPRTEDDKPKAPGSFTQSFMDTGTGTSASVAFESTPPKSPTPFTAQFGGVGAFSAPTDTVGRDPLAEPPKISNPPMASSAGAFTNIFAPEPAKNQTSDPPMEVTRVFERATGEGTISSPQNARASGFTEMFGSTPSSAPALEAKPTTAPAPTEFKSSGFTELFKAKPPETKEGPTPDAPLSPLSAQAGTGRFTELFQESPSCEAPSPAQQTPFSNPGAGGFTEFFKTPSAPATSKPPANPAPADPNPGGFTQLFKGSVESVKATPVSPKPAGELTRMISGGELAPQAQSTNPVPAANAGATRLFSGGAEAPRMAPLPAGPSEYTRVISSRQLRDLQNPVPLASSAAPQVSNQPPAQIPAPQWQVPQFQAQPQPFPIQAPQPPNIPGGFPPAAIPPVAPKSESKIVTYLPLIIGLNVLFLIAVLLILLFALKR